jgi:hypothetical protein
MKRTTSSSTPRTATKAATTPRAAKPRVTRSKAPARSATQVSEAAIAIRAYEIYRARNGAQGDAVSDWLQAEQELRTAQ